ncbi:RusA family crossover junction endodeoxyribonuclease [Megasphaera sueciensis]|uniref:RusA family crossover junction endodeoxyribonuclease n=1 Tax=Megasphaera sueciensis TaxID=349094 RepID=UPI003D04AEFD
MSCYINDKTGAMRITVYGEPFAQERPRFSVFGGHVHAYDPKKSKDYKNTICAETVQLMYMAKQKGYTLPLDCPLQFALYIYRSIPKSFSKAKQRAAREHRLYPSTKPDTDNYIKVVLDGMGFQKSKILFTDDSRIVSIRAVKLYDDQPRIEAWLKPVEQ